MTSTSIGPDPWHLERIFQTRIRCSTLAPVDHLSQAELEKRARHWLAHSTHRERMLLLTLRILRSPRNALEGTAIVRALRFNKVGAWALDGLEYPEDHAPLSRDQDQLCINRLGMKAAQLIMEQDRAGTDG